MIIIIRICPYSLFIIISILIIIITTIIIIINIY
jgi:hypothetical protein